LLQIQLDHLPPLRFAFEMHTLCLQCRVDRQGLYRDIAAMLLAAGAMTGTYLAVASGADLSRCVAAAATAAATYGLLCWLLNLCSVREMLSGLRNRPKAA
jgi:hypothetical protein